MAPHEKITDTNSEHGDSPLMDFAKNIVRIASISDFRLLDALSSIDRKLFVLDELQKDAYADSALPLLPGLDGFLATISQPSLVANMIEYLNLTPDKRVLEIGTGSGYSAALMSKLCREVTTIECVRELVESAKNRLNGLNITNVQVLEADGAHGFEQNAPYDAIVFTSAMKQFPSYLISQLSEEGRLLVPVGTDTHDLTLVLGQRTGNDFQLIELKGVSFVPTITDQVEYGWTKDEIQQYISQSVEGDKKTKTLSEIAHELGIAPDEYRELVRKVFGYKDSVPDESVEGLVMWIQFLRTDIHKKDLIGEF